MPVAGTRVLAELQQAFELARQRTEVLRTEETSLSQRMDELARLRDESVAQLAQFILPDLQREHVGQTYGAVQYELLQLLDQHEKRLGELHNHRDALTLEIEKKVYSQKSLFDTLEELHRQRAMKEAEVAKRLGEDQEFQQFSKSVLEAERQLKANEDCLSELQQSARDKLPAFRQSELFQYLLKRNFGTPDYRATGMVQTLDRWVARLIDFPKARKSYDFLSETPNRMQQELGRRQAAFSEAMQTLEKLRDATAEICGLTPLVTQIANIEHERGELAKSCETLQQQQRTVLSEIEEFQRGVGAVYQSALLKLQTFLKTIDPREIETEARQTPTEKDDEYGHRIAQFTLELNKLMPRAKEIAVLVSQSNRALAGLETVVAQYHQAGYDGERSYFDDSFELSGHLERYSKGLIDAGQLWQTIRQRQKTAPSAMERAAAGAVQIAGSSMSRVLLQGIINAAGVMIEDSARRSVSRREQSTWGNGFPGSPSRDSGSERVIVKPRRGFSTRDQF